MSSLLPWADASEYRKMKNLQAENARLKAEVERLRKAGDAMYNGNIRIYGGHVGNLAEEYTADWNAAKEGKPHA